MEDIRLVEVLSKQSQSYYQVLDVETNNQLMVFSERPLVTGGIYKVTITTTIKVITDTQLLT